MSRLVIFFRWSQLVWRYCPTEIWILTLWILFHRTADLPSNTIDLRNSQTCPFDEGFCIDSMEGSLAWDTTISSECVNTEFISLYTGTVNKTTSNYSGKSNALAIYSAKSDKGLLSIWSIEKTEACEYEVYATDHDHPKIFMYEMHRTICLYSRIHLHSLET